MRPDLIPLPLVPNPYLKLLATAAPGEVYDPYRMFKPESRVALALPPELRDYNPEAYDLHTDAIRREFGHLMALVARDVLIPAYGWSVPDQDAVEAIVRAALRQPSRRIVSVGSGLGYLESLLGACGKPSGVTVQATDARPPVKPWVSVEQGDAVDVAAAAGDALLLMCWPPNGDAMAHNALSAYTGRAVAVLGERVTSGDRALWATLDRDWVPVHSQNLPTWPCIHDRLVIYQRIDR